MLFRDASCLSRCLMGFLVLAVVGSWGTIPLMAQETAQKSAQQEELTEAKKADASNKEVPLSDLIRDHGTVIFQTGPFDQVESDIRRLFNDVGRGEFEGFVYRLLPSKDVGVNMNTGATFYFDELAFYDDPVALFQISDREALLDSLDARAGEFEDGSWERRDNSVQKSWEVLVWPFTDGDSAQITGSNLLFGDSSSSFANELLDAEPLKPRLHSTTADIVDRSGLSVLGLNAERFGFDDFEAKEIIDYLEMDLSQPEKKWLEDFAEIVRATDIAAMGLKYHEDKALEIRSFAQVKDEVSFAKLVDLKAAKEPWIADLGFEAKNLIASVAFKMDTFTSSAAPRLIPQAVTHGLAPGNMNYLRGGMMQTLLSLCGDSWNELSAARIALYHREEDSLLGELTMFGVLDAKDPQKVLDELQRIASLTSPMQNEERKFQRDEEVRKLIEQLAGDDETVSARAYTRLGLVGEPAREQLRELRIETESAELKTRIGHLISVMDSQKVRGHEVGNAMFWATLSPGLELKQTVSMLGEYPVHHIEITPDSSKTEKEVAAATRMMGGIFGTDWNKVSVVQVNDHFVFMLGSDQAKLQRIVERTAAGKGELADELKGVGHGSKVAQMQAWFNPGKVADFTGQYRPNWTDEKMKELLEKDQRLCWLGLNIEEKGIGADLLIPAPQIIPFVFGF